MKDMLGREVQVDDLIVHVSRSGSSTYMNLAKITAIDLPMRGGGTFVRANVIAMNDQYMMKYILKKHRLPIFSVEPIVLRKTRYYVSQNIIVISSHSWNLSENCLYANLKID